MYSEHFSISEAIGFQLTPNTSLFSAGGISPNGESWVVPTALFLRLWHSPSGVELKEQGFRLGNDGKSVGASQDCVVYLPRCANVKD